jgi:hypothetical protein
MSVGSDLKMGSGGAGSFANLILPAPKDPSRNPSMIFVVCFALFIAHHNIKRELCQLSETVTISHPLRKIPKKSMEFENHIDKDY